MNDVASSRPNSLSEWGQNWMDVLAFDPAALDRGIDYIYQLLSMYYGDADPGIAEQTNPPVSSRNHSKLVIIPYL